MLSGKRMLVVAGRILRPPSVSYMNNPRRISHAGRRPFIHGMIAPNSLDVGVVVSKRMLSW